MSELGKPVGTRITWEVKSRNGTFMRTGIVIAHVEPGASAHATLVGLRPGTRIPPGIDDTSSIARYLVEVPIGIPPDIAYRYYAPMVSKIDLTGARPQRRAKKLAREAAARGELPAGVAPPPGRGRPKKKPPSTT